MARLLALLRDRKDEIGSISAIVGVLIGFFGFFLTIQQLKSSGRTLQATNAYEIQKDARALIDEVSRDDLVQQAMSGKPLGAVDTVKLQGMLWKMQNFYLSVFRQKAAGGISTDFSSSFAADFCDFIKNPRISSDWDLMLKSGMLTKNHVKMREDWCHAK